MEELGTDMEPLDVDCSDTETEDDTSDVLDVDCEQHDVPDEDDSDTVATTSFGEVEEFFLAGITDDMFMELTREDTEAMLDEILLAALPHFEFPHFDLFNASALKERRFIQELTLEEMMIIRQYMTVEWLGFQLASVDVVRQKYSSSDFKFTSQASHMSKLTDLKDHYESQGYKMQRVYCRRRKASTVDGYVSTMDMIMQPICG